MFVGTEGKICLGTSLSALARLDDGEVTGVIVSVKLI